MSSVTVITGVERRRRWPVADRMRILEALSEPGATVAEVARRHDVCTSLIYKWRRDAAPRAAMAFVPARLVEESGERDARGGGGGSNASAIVIELAGGTRVTIGAHACAATVTAALRALAR